MTPAEAVALIAGEIGWVNVGAPENREWRSGRAGPTMAFHEQLIELGAHRAMRWAHTRFVVSFSHDRWALHKRGVPVEGRPGAFVTGTALASGEWKDGQWGHPDTVRDVLSEAIRRSKA